MRDREAELDARERRLEGKLDARDRFLEEYSRLRILAAGKHNRTSAASADHVESLGRDLLHVHGATPLLRVIDDLLQTFGPLPALTANDLAAAEDPVSTLMEVAETFRFEHLPLSE